jgi:hypothetical protein
VDRGTTDIQGVMDGLNNDMNPTVIRLAEEDSWPGLNTIKVTPIPPQYQVQSAKHWNIFAPGRSRWMGK